MKLFTRILAAAALMLGLTTQAHAQEVKVETKPYPYMFIGLQGGAQIALQDYYDNMHTFIGQASIGAQFTPVIGARLSAQGWQTKGGLKSVEHTFKYNYADANLDLMLNLTNLFSKKNYHPLNLYLIGGVGLDYAWKNDDLKGLNAQRLDGTLPITESLANQWDDDLLTHNFRAALMLDYDICRNFSVNLELGAQSKGDRWNSIQTNSDDWHAYGLLGLAVKFGHKKVKTVIPAPAPEPEPEPVYVTKVDTIWYTDVAYKDVEVLETIERNVFFPLRGYNSQSPCRKELVEIADFVKTHTDCAVEINSYADRGTGNPRINKRYSKQRLEGTTAALIELGVPADIIKGDYHGDTQQPFAENDLNRVSIVVVKGTATVKQPVETAPKFRLEEKRVLVTE